MTTTTTPTTQRDWMRMLVGKHGYSKERVAAEYAALERTGVIQRASNLHHISPEAYAEALWSDGTRKGWLRRPPIHSSL